jgi:DNA-binding NtrC family response regulator
MSNLILIIDDDAEIVRAMEIGLTLEGFEVRVAGHVAPAMEVISNAAPAIVFLDYYLAGDNPAEFVRKAKTLYPDMPIILMTAADSASDKAKNVGLAHYLQKPFELERLQHVVRRCMTRLSRQTTIPASS